MGTGAFWQPPFACLPLPHGGDTGCWIGVVLHLAWSDEQLELQLNQSEYDGILSPVVKFGLGPQAPVHCEYAPAQSAGCGGSAKAACGRISVADTKTPVKKNVRRFV
jgi:hypothetical protein